MLSVQAIDVPSTMSIPTVAIDTTPNTNVKVSWTAPNSHSSAIAQYEILFKTSSGTYVTDLTNCDGSSGTIMTNLYCTVPMSEIQTVTSLTVD